MPQQVTEFPKYRCHKEVHAIKIGAADRHKDGTVTIVPKDSNLYDTFTAGSDWGARFKPMDDNGGDAGYYIVYEDDYRSWSPTKAFEEGYTLTSHLDDEDPCPVESAIVKT